MSVFVALASAHDWLPRETLTRLCAIPSSAFWNRNGTSAPVQWKPAFSDPLLWFGLLESRIEGKSPTEVFDRRLYRKAPLFDCFVKFNVQVEGSDTRH